MKLSIFKECLPTWKIILSKLVHCVIGGVVYKRSKIWVHRHVSFLSVHQAESLHGPPSISSQWTWIHTDPSSAKKRRVHHNISNSAHPTIIMKAFRTSRHLCRTHNSSYRRFIQSSTPKSAIPIAHPPAPGPPPPAPSKQYSETEDRIERKKIIAARLAESRAFKPDAKKTSLLKQRFWKDVSVKETSGTFLSIIHALMSLFLKQMTNWKCVLV
jgi:hypothetical protein